LPRPKQTQSKKFIEAAREIECDESDGGLERVFKGIDPKETDKKIRTRARINRLF